MREEAVAKSHQALAEAAAKGHCLQTARQHATVQALVEPESKGRELQDAWQRDTTAA